MTTANQANVVSMFPEPQVKYTVVPRTKLFEGGGSFITYGIEAFQDEQSVFRIKELSVDYEKVKRFVELCNTYKASLEHIEDLVHDNFSYELCYEENLKL